MANIPMMMILMLMMIKDRIRISLMVIAKARWRLCASVGIAGLDNFYIYVRSQSLHSPVSVFVYII